MLSINRKRQLPFVYSVATVRKVMLDAVKRIRLRIYSNNVYVKFLMNLNEGGIKSVFSIVFTKY